MRSKAIRRIYESFTVQKVLWLFAAEGILLQFYTSVNSFCNNLFATNLGATDAQIGLIQLVPNMVAVLLMLPVGILSARAKTSWSVPRALLFIELFGFILMGFVPAAAGFEMPLFFASLAFTVGGPALYGAQWQVFFGDVVGEESRNQALTVRNRAMMIIAVLIPLICGALLFAQADVQKKIGIMRVFYWLCALFTIGQILTLNSVPAPVREENEKKTSFTVNDLRDTAVELVHHKPFVRFFIPVVLFYICWQLDWSMWYIAQVQYVGMTETDLSIYSAVSSLIRFVFLGIGARVVQKKGPDFGLILSSLGLATCPLTVIVSTLMPDPMKPMTFTLMYGFLNAPESMITICVVQILLRVAPIKRRTLAATIFTLTTTLTNAVFPSIGVALYTALGADYKGLILFNVTAFLMRVGITLVLFKRYQNLQKNALNGY